MPVLPWLWLSEAARLVAERLSAEQPEKFAEAGAALSAAQEQLLDQAYRGALPVEGRFFQISEEPDAMLGAWATIDPSWWAPEYRPESPSPSVCVVTLNWETNSFWYELDDRDNEGYRDLRVRAEDIDPLWPIGHHERSTPLQSVPSIIKNPGGAPRKWRDDLFVEIIRVANTPDGLPDERSQLIRHLRGLNLPHWGPNDSPSDGTIRVVVNEVYNALAQKPDF